MICREINIHVINYMETEKIPIPEAVSNKLEKTCGRLFLSISDKHVENQSDSKRFEALRVRNLQKILFSKG